MLILSGLDENAFNTYYISNLAYKPLKTIYKFEHVFYYCDDKGIGHKI